MSDRTTRRKFIATSAIVAGGLAGTKFWHTRHQASVSSRSSSATATSSTQAADPTPLPERLFGRTEESLPIFGLGGAGQTPLSKSGQTEASVALIEKAIGLGIRYFDTAASYGPSEENFGRVLPQYRDRVFIASKTAASDRDRAWRELERSLTRLKVDRLDLWQMHHVSFTEELDRLESPSGALKAVEEAREQGLIRYTGITGHHDPEVIAEGLRRYPFDMTLIPVNAADPHHPQPFLPVVLPVARERNVAVVGMKVPAYGKLLPAIGGMQNALNYALSVPGVFGCVVAAENPRQLEENVNYVRQLTALDDAGRAALENRVASAWEEVTFYRNWT